MCLKTPLKEEAFELREHSFEVVFDILKMCAVAARLGQQMVANGSSKGARGQTEEEVIFNTILKLLMLTLTLVDKLSKRVKKLFE